MIRLASLVSTITFIAVLLLGYLNVFIEASQVGYTANLLGQPIGGMAPRFAWELHIAIVLLGFGTVLLLQQVTAFKDPSHRRASFSAIALLLLLVHVIAITLKETAWVYDNIISKSFVLGASSQLVLLAIGIALVFVVTKVHYEAVNS